MQMSIRINRYGKLALYCVEDIRKSLGDDCKYSEMTAFDHAFLGGCLEKKRPGKVLEVGIAAGVTSAVILGILNETGLAEATLYSLDVSKAWYRDAKQETGFVAEKWKKNNPNKVKHLRLFGTVADHIKNICSDGEKIDFLILDTMHILPGELLDFLICYPYLADNAMVVLHDVNLMHVLTMDPQALATRILFDSVSAEKFYMDDRSNVEKVANIAAFITDKGTGDCIYDLFRRLCMPWCYMPSDEQLAVYRDAMDGLYGSALAKEFDDIVRLQKHTMDAVTIGKHWGGGIKELVDRWRNCEEIFVYGCGVWGRKYYEFAGSNGLPINGMLISDDQEMGSDRFGNNKEIPINKLSFLCGRKGANIILGVGEENREACIKELSTLGLKDILLSPDK